MLLASHETISWWSPKGGTFSSKYANECIYNVCKYYKTWMNSQKKRNIRFASLYSVLAYESPWHNHFKMINSINHVQIWCPQQGDMFFGNECW
jgi:hypothetical protein